MTDKMIDIYFVQNDTVLQTVQLETVPREGERVLFKKTTSSTGIIEESYYLVKSVRYDISKEIYDENYTPHYEMVVILQVEIIKIGKIK